MLGIWICGCSLFYRRELWDSKSSGFNSTGKSFSEALILESFNPLYDDMLCTKIVFCYIQNNFCTQHVLNLYFSCTEDLLSYCGLTDSRMSASDTDLPVLKASKSSGAKGDVL